MYNVNYIEAIQGKVCRNLLHNRGNPNIIPYNHITCYWPIITNHIISYATFNTAQITFYYSYQYTELYILSYVSIYTWQCISWCMLYVLYTVPFVSEPKILELLLNLDDNVKIIIHYHTATHTQRHTILDLPHCDRSSHGHMYTNLTQKHLGSHKSNTGKQLVVRH